MNVWIMIAVIGAVLMVIEMALVTREYRRGRLRRSEFLLNVLAAVMVVPIVLTMMLIGTPEDPAPGFAIFLPLWLALIVVIRRRRQERMASVRRDGEG